MASTIQGSFRLFRLAGIDLFLHWSWFLVAWYGISQRVGQYTSPIWNVLEYLALFAIVLLHEFGHALACRQVGGHADRIVLWPLGGVAYVQPPQRPGATLWSIAAGPLVNVALAPALFLLIRLMRVSGVLSPASNMFRLLEAIAFINVGLLIFNLLPIYPLDGGQIVRSLLWFVVGRAWSLTVATVLGFLGVAGLVLLALVSRSVWLGVMSVFILMNCWQGLRYGLRLIRIARMPRREGPACPSCGTGPLMGAFWMCSECHGVFDLFENQAVCPHCGSVSTVTRCPDCGTESFIGAWKPSSTQDHAFEGPKPSSGPQPGPVQTPAESDPA